MHRQRNALNIFPDDNEVNEESVARSADMNHPTSFHNFLNPMDSQFSTYAEVQSFYGWNTNNQIKSERQWNQDGELDTSNGVFSERFNIGAGSRNRPLFFRGTSSNHGEHAPENVAERMDFQGKSSAVGNNVLEEPRGWDLCGKRSAFDGSSAQFCRGESSSSSLQAENVRRHGTANVALSAPSEHQFPRSCLDNSQEMDFLAMSRSSAPWFHPRIAPYESRDLRSTSVTPSSSAFSNSAVFQSHANSMRASSSSRTVQRQQNSMSDSRSRNSSLWAGSQGDCMNNHSSYMPLSEMRNTHEQMGWNLSNGNGTYCGASPSVRMFPNSSIHHLPFSWLPHRQPNVQRFVDVPPWSLFPPPDSGAPIPSLPCLDARNGRHPRFLRSNMMERENIAVHGFLPSHRGFSNDFDGRSRAISEDYMILGQLYHSIPEMHDSHRDMRLDVDNMSYEELLALEERIGNVSTGLAEETIFKLMKQKKCAARDASCEPCCICQEEYTDGENLGILDCGHSFHASCIKQWLTLKNLCPICKMNALLA